MSFACNICVLKSKLYSSLYLLFTSLYSMSRCSQNFSMFDFPTPFLPDDLLPLVASSSREGCQQLLMEVQGKSQEKSARAQGAVGRTERRAEGQEQMANLDIILSKLLNNDELNDIELQQLSEQERLAVADVQEKIEVGGKRPDEYQKLFYRRAFKFAEREFFGKRCKNKSRKMSSFYHFYFGSTAQRMGIPLLNFYHPDKRTRPGLKVGQKSFNKAYIRLLLRSDSFRDASRLYRGKFILECKEERKEKIQKFSKYLRGVIAKNPAKISEIIRSSKCKVPWSNQDIVEADRRACEDLEHYNFQFSENGGDQAQNEAQESCPESE